MQCGCLLSSRLANALGRTTGLLLRRSRVDRGLHASGQQGLVDVGLSQVQNFVTLYKALGGGWTAATESGPVGAEDITHQTWTGTTRRAMKTGVFNGRREFGE